MFNYARLPLSHNLTNPWKNVSAFFTFELSTKTDYVVGETLNLTVVVEIPAYQSKNIQIIYVEPDGAMKYSPTKKIPTDFSFLFLKRYFDVYGGAVWLNSQLIVYTVTGSFGFRIDISNSLDMALADHFETKAMFSIAPQDLLISKRNLALTTTLTFLILFFAVLDLIRIDKDKKSPQKSGGKNSRMYH